MAQKHPGILHADFLDMRSILNQDQSMILFMSFACAQSVDACPGDSHRTMVVKAPSFFLFFWPVALVGASAGVTAR